MGAAFRVDASPAIGTGHAYRCMTLALVLRNHGIESTFICRHMPDSLAAILKANGFNCIRLRPASKVTGDIWCSHASWLEADWREDAESTRDALTGLDVEWLVVDHYAIDHHWHSMLRESCDRLLVIDDLADRRHDCDVLLDQNFIKDFNSRYESLISNGCRALLGPEFALLRPEFAALHEATQPRSGEIRRLLVFMGGIDLANITSTVLEGIKLLDSRIIACDIVAGASNPHRQAIEALSRKVRGCRMFGGVDSLAPLMMAADLGIGAAGTTTWERCCLGLPSLTMAVADNQSSVAEASQIGGYAVNLGKCESVTPELIARGIEHLLNNPHLVHQMSIAGMRLVDGRGAERVAQTLLTISQPSVRTA